MIYARAHDQNVAEDYFSAMQRVEQRLEIAPVKKEEDMEDVQVQEKMFQLIDQLKLPELCFEERLDVASQLREVLSKVNEHVPLN
jgi:hypothetical protein